ncbi:MAG: hypothetical protein AB7F41_10885 [Methylocystis sp.]|uniref:hypothetical protein n=1 Tax=Methylocystis sp. TaxID=1911079 RepID=UPI003D0AF393
MKVYPGVHGDFSLRAGVARNISGQTVKTLTVAWRWASPEGRQSSAAIGCAAWACLVRPHVLVKDFAGERVQRELKSSRDAN